MSIQLRSLSQEERIEAHNAALDAVRSLAGAAPRRVQFEREQTTQFPSWLLRTIVAIAIFAMIAAFLWSAFRLHYIGKVSSLESINNNTVAEITGWAVVVLAELTAIVAVVALAVLPNRPSTKRVLYLAILLSVILAYAGNYFVVIDNKPGVSLWFWIETFLPPTLTLCLSYIVKEVFLRFIEQRHEVNQLYNQAYRDWQNLSKKPEKHPSFMQFKANAIWDAIRTANDSGRGKSERMALLDSLSRREKIILVSRELKADEWFDEDALNDVQLNANFERAVQTVQPSDAFIQLTPAYSAISTEQQRPIASSESSVQKVERRAGFDTNRVQNRANLNASKPEQIAQILQDNPQLEGLSYSELLDVPAIAKITTSKGTISAAKKLLDD